jgi:hypothetical protein
MALGSNDNDKGKDTDVALQQRGQNLLCNALEWVLRVQRPRAEERVYGCFTPAIVTVRAEEMKREIKRGETE